MRWSRRVIVVGALLVAPLALMASPAGAWTSPYNTPETYYMPGPPPGSYLSACAVTTLNGANGSTAISYIEGEYNSYSLCYFIQTQVVYYNGGPVGGPWNYGYYNDYVQSLAPGPYSDIGGNFNACNVYSYCQEWSTSWIT